MVVCDDENALFSPPAMKLGQGNIFRSVCQEFCPRGEFLGRSHRAGSLNQSGTPPRQVNPDYRWSMRGRYASYWNAFLLRNFNTQRCLRVYRHRAAVAEADWVPLEYIVMLGNGSQTQTQWDPICRCHLRGFSQR